MRMTEQKARKEPPALTGCEIINNTWSGSLTLDLMGEKKKAKTILQWNDLSLCGIRLKSV